jgi:hypothetical protein
MRGEGAVQARRAGPSAPDRIEPVFQAAAGEQARAPLLSDALDYIVSIQAADGVAGDAVLAAADAGLAPCSKPVNWEGFNEADGQWEALRADHGYAMVRAGLQMVDRRGVAGAEELEAFGNGMQKAAAALGAVAAPSDPGPALARAVELDRFCNEVDIQIALNLVSTGEPFGGSKLRSLAEAGGLVLETDGKFRRRDQSGRTLYELANLEPAAFDDASLAALTFGGLTVQLDVPRAPGAERTFRQFREFVHQLARSLGASIVDDNRRLLAPSAFDTIETQLRSVYEAMEARGFGAGGRQALRLFS